MLYVTLLDQFHPGIYSSQVIDVCAHLKLNHGVSVRLVAFLSPKEYFGSDARKEIRRLSPHSLVLPAFPGIRNFRFTAFLLIIICLLTGERVAICRNCFCTAMALIVKRIGLLRKVVYDGRSATAAEIEEYDVFPLDYFRKNAAEFESEAVNKSDFRIAVSAKLVEYWRRRFGYADDAHVVIPCTLDSRHFNHSSFSDFYAGNSVRDSFGCDREDTLLVYSGSTAPWQSFALLEETLTPLLEDNNKISILFLSGENDDNRRFRDRFPGKVFIKWVGHADVLNYLSAADFGILVREQSVTNEVASPVKFAEYLYAGLKVLISDSLGDISDFVRLHDCGYVVNKHEDWKKNLRQSTRDERERLFALSTTYFRKESPFVDERYRRLTEQINLIGNNAK